MKHLMSALLIGTLAVFSSGCGVFMAFTQPSPIDTDALEQGKGLPRTYLVEKMGPPTSTTLNDDGTRSDVFQFYEGSSTGWKVGRGMFHLVADFLTICLWEIVATPMEFAVRGDKITAQAEFDKSERLVSFLVLGREQKPLEKIHKQQNGG